MKELTKAEEQLMQYLWKLERAYLKDIVAEYPDPKPAYTTISTVVNVLVKKGFIGFETHGKAREYFPGVQKKGYTRQAFSGMLKGFFNNSPQQFASFFASDSQLDVKELEEINQLIQEEINRKKNGEMSVFIYLTQTSVTLAFVYLFYRFALSNTTYFGTNRAVLVSMLLLALAAPLVKLPGDWSEPATRITQ
jgi:predicted transcriptional regulator